MLAWFSRSAIKSFRRRPPLPRSKPRSACRCVTSCNTGYCGPWDFRDGPSDRRTALLRIHGALAPEFQRVVICHELLHIKNAVILHWSRSPKRSPSQLCGLIRGCGCFARVSGSAREQVVDGHVVMLLGNRDGTCAVSSTVRTRFAPFFSKAGAGMLRPRELRARVDAMFQEVTCRASVAFAALRSR